MICKRKAIGGQRLPESSCARKGAVNIDISITSSNGDRNIMQLLE